MKFKTLLFCCFIFNINLSHSQIPIQYCDCNDYIKDMYWEIVIDDIDTSKFEKEVLRKKLFYFSKISDKKYKKKIQHIFNKNEVSFFVDKNSKNPICDLLFHFDQKVKQKSIDKELYRRLSISIDIPKIKNGIHLWYFPSIQGNIELLLLDEDSSKVIIYDLGINNHTFHHQNQSPLNPKEIYFQKINLSKKYRKVVIKKKMKTLSQYNELGKRFAVRDGYQIILEFKQNGKSHFVSYDNPEDEITETSPKFTKRFLELWEVIKQEINWKEIRKIIFYKYYN